MATIPRPTAPIADMIGGRILVSREWFDYFRLRAESGDLAAINEELAELRKLIGDIESTSSGSIKGTQNIHVSGQLNNGAVVIDLAKLADQGGGELLKIMRDEFGRVAGSSAAVLTDLSNVGGTAVLGDVLQWTGTQWEPKPAAGGSGSSPQIDVFTASGTWTRPTAAKMVHAIAIGGGGSGGNGTNGSTSATRAGGGGGGGGGCSVAMFIASQLGATVAVTVGAGGLGGVGGGDGLAGGVSKFGTMVVAGGGGGGGRGLGNTNPGGTAGTGNLEPGAVGGTGGTTTSGTKGGDTTMAGAGGGGGHGVSNANNEGGGTNTGGSALGGSNAGGTAGTAGGGAAGGAGGAAPAPIYSTAGAGGGGGGGGCNATGFSGGRGGAGKFGGGGGGGGGATTGSTVGAGGDGGDGVVIVTTYF